MYDVRLNVLLKRRSTNVGTPLALLLSFPTSSPGKEERKMVQRQSSLLRGQSPVGK